MNSKGISQRANGLENKYSLRDKHYYHLETFEWLAEVMCRRYKIEKPHVRFGRNSIRKRGGYSAIRYLPNSGTITINPIGQTLGTCLHELAHHLAYSQGYKGHGREFKDWHERILLDFVEGQMFEHWDDVDMVEEAENLWNSHPEIYNEVWHEGISTRELVQKANEKLA